MKTLLSLILILSLSIPLFGQTYSGDVILDTQAEVDSFGALGYTKIHGELHIMNTSITSLSAFSGLTEINGTLIIRNNDNLHNLTGFHNVNKITKIEISSNDSITSLEGLNALDTVLNHFFIWNNSNLINLNGLEDFNYISGILGIESNPVLENLSGLENLTQVVTQPAGIRIIQNANLTSINSLTQLTACRGVIIESNESLTSLDSAFTYLTQMHVIKINQNLVLHSFGSAFQQITYFNRILISNNPQITSLENINQITYCSELLIENNDQLVSIPDFNFLTNCHELKIIDNDLLTVSGNFNALTFIYDLIVTGNPELLSLPNFPNFSIYLLTVNISNNATLNSLTGLDSITSINHLDIQNNPNLINLDGLNAVYGIGYFTLHNNTSLRSLYGLENLALLQAITITDNDSLVNYCPINSYINSLDSTSNVIIYNSINISNNLYNPTVEDIQNGECIDCNLNPIITSVTEVEQEIISDQDNASYQWLDGANNFALIPNDTLQTFSSLTYGNIALEINYYGCIDTIVGITNCVAYPIDLSISESELVFTANQDSATYQWLDCDNNYAPILNDTNRTFSSTIYGNIAVEINRHGCIDTTTCITNCGADLIDLSISEIEYEFTANQDSATYQWLDCNNNYAPIVNDTNQTFSSETYPNIAVEISYKGCVKTTSCITNCAAYTLDVSTTESGQQITANQDSATYQWLNCDNNYALIPNETSQTFSSDTYGNFAVEINYYGCIDTTDCTTLTTLNSTTHSFNLISISPNPTVNYTIIDFGDLKNLNLNIYNPLGKLIYHKTNLNQQTYTINTSGYTSGLYLLEIYDAYTRKQFKIIK